MSRAAKKAADEAAKAAAKAQQTINTLDTSVGTLTKSMEALVEIFKAQARATEESNEKAKEQFAKGEKRKEQLKELAAAERKIAQEINEHRIALGLLTEEEDEQAKELAELTAAAEEAEEKFKELATTAGITAEKLAEARKDVIETKKALLNLKQEADFAKEGKSLVKGLGGSINKISRLAGFDLDSKAGKSFTSFAGKINKARASGKSMTDITKMMGKGLKGLNPAAIAVSAGFGVAQSVIQKYVEASIAAYKTTMQLSESLVRDLGVATSEKQVEQLLKISQATGDANVTYKMLGETVGVLSQKSRGLFGNLLTGANKHLPQLIASFKGVGVEVEASSELFTTFGAIMGKRNIASITKLQKHIVKAAKTIGISATQMTKEVAAAAEELVFFGERAGKMSMQLVNLAARAGVSAKTVAGIGQSFQFYPDAIAKANELNLILGRSALDGQEMFETFRQEGPAGAAIKTLDKMSESMGDITGPEHEAMIQGVLGALNLQGKEAARIVELMKEAKRTGRSIADLNAEGARNAERNEAAMQKYTTLSTELAKFQEKFAVALSPFAEMLTDFIKTLNGLSNEALGALSGSLVGGGIGAGIGFLVGGPVGAGIGLAIGMGAGALLGAVSAEPSAKVNDMILTEDGKMIEPSPRDTIVAMQPGGPIAESLSSAGVNAAASASGGAAVAQINVDLFGERLVNRMVQLVTDGQSKQAQVNDIVMGRA